MISEAVMEQYAREYAFSQATQAERRVVTSWIIRNCRPCGVSWRDQGAPEDKTCWVCGE